MIITSLDAHEFRAATEAFAQARTEKTAAILGRSAVRDALENRQKYERIASADPQATTPLDRYIEQQDLFHGRANDLLKLQPDNFQITDVLPGYLRLERGQKFMDIEVLQASLTDTVDAVELSKRFTRLLRDTRANYGITIASDPDEPSAEEVALVTNVATKLSGLALYLIGE